MKIKRIVSVAATFVMALGLFTGCGAASTDTTTTTANNNTTAVQDTVKATESDRQHLLQARRHLLYIIQQQEALRQLHRLLLKMQMQIFSRYHLLILIQMMTLTGLIITVVFLRNIMMKTLEM